MNNKKLKVVWLCYFSNKKVQDILNPRKKIGEIAPWISSMISLFENNPDVELHLVSEHRWISGIKHFKKNSVHYHFFNRGIPLLGRHWPGFMPFDLYTNYYKLNRRVAQIIETISPDIIHMHGAENEFCQSIFQFRNKYPVFITVQGILSNTIFASQTKDLRTLKRIENELKIFKLFRHFGYRTETMGKDIKKLSPLATLHWHNYPMKTIGTYTKEKKFDIVFFGRITKEKGIDDLLHAVALIKKIKNDVSLCVMGGGVTDGYQKLADDLNISHNVYWAGFLPTQEDVHTVAASARITVLPVYSEIISGTIVESMFLKIPVVAYDVGSIHEVNKYDEIISLVPRGDVPALASSILKLLSDEKLQHEKAEIGYKRAVEMFSVGNEQIRAQLLNAYDDVTADFQQN